MNKRQVGADEPKVVPWDEYCELYDQSMQHLSLALRADAKIAHLEREITKLKGDLANAIAAKSAAQPTGA